jgi:transposase
MLKDWIEYFAKLFGKVCVLVPPAYSTQECHACDHREPKTLSQRWHSCSCGCEMDRDQNAALVLLQRGLKQWEQGSRGHRQTQVETPETPVDR